MKTLTIIATIAAIAALAAIFFCSLLTGCSAAPRPAPDAPIHAALTTAAVHVEDHILDARAHVEKAVPHADVLGKAELIDASDDLHQALASQADQTAAVTQLAGRVDALERQLIALTDKYEILAGRWYVKAGIWIEWAAWWILIAWAAIGFAGMLMPILAPGSIIATIGTEVLHFLPVANPFRWLGLLTTTRTTTATTSAP